MQIICKQKWSPFIVGAGIGLLTVSSYYFFGHFVGVSSAFVTIVAWIGTFFDSAYIQNSLYFSNMVTGIKDVFQVSLIIGIVVGAAISAFFGKTFVQDTVPGVWRASFGPSFTKRAVGAFFGGVVIIFGARLAGGCTSGKAISSGLQLLVPAWVFIATLFITGIIVAHILYKR